MLALPRKSSCSAAGWRRGARGDAPPAAGLSNPSLSRACAARQAYGTKRGYWSSKKSTPDEPRSARELLKDYVAGKLLFAHPPPGLSPEMERWWTAQRYG